MSRGSLFFHERRNNIFTVKLIGPGGEAELDFDTQEELAAALIDLGKIASSTGYLEMIRHLQRIHEGQKELPCRPGRM